MIAVLTTRREGAASGYLATTLADIESSARSEHRILVCDGVQLEPRPGWQQVIVDKPTTAPENRWAAWQAIALATMYGEDLVMFEDDLRLCVNAAAVIEETEIPDDVAFASFYAPFGDGTTPWGWWKSSCRTYLFAQCLKIPLRTCQVLAGAIAEMRRCRLGGSDEVLRAMGTARGWQWAIHYPGLVQHVGAVSAVGNGNLRGTRSSRDYQGDAFDARTLRRDLYR